MEEEVFQPVGEGPLYEPIREAARALLPEFDPWECGHRTDGQGWGAGPLSLYPTTEATHRLVALRDPIGKWVQQGTTFRTEVDLETLRAAAIGMLVYCEAQERNRVS